MKNIIVAILIAGLILGFTLRVNKAKVSSAFRVKAPGKIDFSHTLEDKRVASWD